MDMFQSFTSLNRPRPVSKNIPHAKKKTYRSHDIVTSQREVSRNHPEWAENIFPTHGGFGVQGCC